VDILAVRQVKQGIEAERFRADQLLVQITYHNLYISTPNSTWLYHVTVNSGLGWLTIDDTQWATMLTYAQK
jgi:hypothetical protein